MIRKHGRKALMFYFLWCLLKGLAFLFLGVHFFGKSAHHSPGSAAPDKLSMFDLPVEQIGGDGSGLMAVVVLISLSVIVFSIRWMNRIMKKDYDLSSNNRFLEEMDKDLYR